MKWTDAWMHHWSRDRGEIYIVLSSILKSGSTAAIPHWDLSLQMLTNTEQLKTQMVETKKWDQTQCVCVCVSTVQAVAAPAGVIL